MMGTAPRSMRSQETANCIDDYRRDGYLFPIDALTSAEADRYLGQYGLVADSLGSTPKAVQLSQVHRFHGWAWELATHPGVLDAVEGVLGPDILLWSASMFPKRARDPGYVTMHQDGTYWGLEGGEVTTAWVALTESTRKNGCMRLLPGSHRSKILPHRDTHAADNLLTRGQVVQADYDEADVVDVELRAGQLSLHHVRTIHGSHRNRSDRPRIGIAMRYMTPEVRPLRRGESAALVRGRDRCGNWCLQSEPPAFDSIEQAVRAHRREAQRFVAALTAD